MPGGICLSGGLSARGTVTFGKTSWIEERCFCICVKQKQPTKTFFCLRCGRFSGSHRFFLGHPDPVPGVSVSFAVVASYLLMLVLGLEYQPGSGRNFEGFRCDFPSGGLGVPCCGLRGIPACLCMCCRKLSPKRGKTSTKKTCPGNLHFIPRIFNFVVSVNEFVEKEPLCAS